MDQRVRDACVANPFIEEPDAIELARPDLRGLGKVTSLVYPTMQCRQRMIP